MTDRERWIVYPLLFLTLGISVKDKMFKLVKTDTVLCKRLIVTDQSEHERIVATTNSTGGVLQIEGDNKLAGLVKVDTVSCNKLVVTDRSGRDRIVATTSPTGGIVQIEENNQNSKLVLGYINNVVGVLFADAQGNVTSPPSVALPADGETKTKQPQKPEGDSPKPLNEPQQK